MGIAGKAYAFAKAKHEGHFRRDGVTPYFNHCIAVADLCENQMEAAVAYCHDLVEDGRATLDEVRAELGGELAEYVEVLTHGKEELYFDYIQRIMDFSKREYGLFRQDLLPMRVKLADIVANLSDKPTKNQVVKYNKVLKIFAGVRHD
jgi:GTP pyrophosphokinase